MSWEDLVAVALIGTDRRPVSGAVPDGSPPGLEPALAERGPEDRLLGAAAVWTVARRAGAAAGDAVAVTAVEADERPVAPGARLGALLDGEHPELVPEWLALAARAGLRPPPELVPDLLDRAARDPALHAAVGAATGPLGRWLADRAPRWAFVRGAGDEVEAVWAEGERAERRALFTRLRSTDPAAGRELLASTFADEAWEDREAFVTALATGVSDADEPFLEAALDDPRKPVRDAAAWLLTGLPSSRYAARMAERAAPLLRVEAGRLAVELPGEPDAAAKRDGLTATRRAQRLHRLLAAAPLATWTGATAAPAAPSAAASPASQATAESSSPAAPDAPTDPDAPTAPDVPRASPLPAAATAPASPATLVALRVTDDLGAIVHAAWAEAAQAQRDPEWARALWEHHPDPALLPALPRAEAEALAVAAAAPDLAASALTGQWGLELSRAVIASIRRRREAGERGADAGVAGYRLDPALAVEAEALRDLGGRDLWTLCDVLAARAAMLRELS